MARLLIVAGLLFVAACSKKDDAPTDKAGDKPVAEKPVADKPVAEKPADPPAAPIKQATNVADLGKLPIDSDMVLGVNVAQAQASPLWRDFVAPGLLTGDVKARLDEFKQKCGIDPLEAVKSATLGLKDGNEGAIVIHGPDKAKVMACADKMKADKDAKVEISRDGDTTILTPKGGGSAVAFQFTSDTDAVIALGSRANAAGIKGILASTSTLSTSAAFVDMYNRIETEKTLWFLVNGKHPRFKPLAMAGVKPTHVYGVVDAANGLDVEMRMRLASADQATQSATMFKSQLAPAAGLLKMDKLDVVGDGSDLKFIIVVSQANLGGMLSSLKGLMGQMGGAMGGPQ